MLRVVSDVLTAADAQQVTLLGILDLSAGFDCVDHQLLLHRLHRDFRLMDTVLNWVTLFVSGRSQQVVCHCTHHLLTPASDSAVCCQLYSICSLECCRGLFRPILFVMYTAELSHEVAQHDLKFHQYVDDCQIYVSTLVNAVHSAIDRFLCCLEDVKAWMTASQLRLNASKTQVMLRSSRHNLDRVTVSEVQVITSTVSVG